ncbi:hypothetical protein M408DRAFT_27454 [Serendipita vermifera MAFF 305830]|uniref:Protein OS-9 homolog n=1 Tax=Serendipita vermifera MAFF 305830 TaxID=933852 RepID=A0A0C2X3R7_SERVB|nr:hypothetical protein M408DRAFT_27454 [Serendipita vermifera MAFF 305830]
MLPLALIALVLLSSESLALRSSTLPEDLYAFPKYKIQFLNGHPVLNVTAQRWLQEGLIDEQEFLGLHKVPIVTRTDVKGIASGPEDELATATQGNQPPASKQPPTLEKLRLGSADYLCLMVPPPAVVAAPEDAQHTPQPIETWELLQPLEGTCLYHRQGWFSYAYCHGQHVRQFREKDPQLPIGLINPPLEDPNEPSYTLGHAPSTVHHDEDADGHISVPEQAALANRLELARGAGHRYLTLHWGDGTVCDKTGRKRETEIQASDVSFHCSMTTTDSIFFIKETKTCQYVLVIHTPRLCGQPGFKSPREDLRDTPLRCRKVVNTLEGTDPTLPESPLPFQRREPKPLPAPRPTATGDDKKQSPGKHDNDAHSQLLKAALDALLGRQTEPKRAERDARGASDGKTTGGGDGSAEKKLEQRFVAVSVDEDGEIKIEKFLGNDGKVDQPEEDDDVEVMEIELAGGEDAARLMKILRDAGYDARALGQDDGEDDDQLETHDEL